MSALLLPGSVSRRAFDKGCSRGSLLLSTATIHELDDVLRRPGFDKYLHEEERIRFLTMLVREALLTKVQESVKQCRDPKDDKYLELAVAGAAHCIVTGDQDLLVLNPFRGIAVVTPRQFLEGAY